MHRLIPACRTAVAGLLAIAGLLALSACGGASSDNVSLDPDDVKYAYDARHGFCFAYTGSGKVMNAETTGLALANVPCTPSVMAAITGTPATSFQGAPFEPGRAYRCRLDGDANVTCQPRE